MKHSFQNDVQVANVRVFRQENKDSDKGSSNSHSSLDLAEIEEYAEKESLPILPYLWQDDSMEFVH